MKIKIPGRERSVEEKSWRYGRISLVTGGNMLQET